MNSLLWSYMISIGLGYLDSHEVSTKFAIVIAPLSSYRTTSNHPVVVLISVTAFKLKFSLLPFHHITLGTIISTQSLFHGISSASLDGNLPYSLFDFFVR